MHTGTGPGQTNGLQAEVSVLLEHEVNVVVEYRMCTAGACIPEAGVKLGTGCPAALRSLTGLTGAACILRIGAVEQEPNTMM